MNRSELVSLAIGAILLGATAASAAGLPASLNGTPAGGANGCGGASGCGQAPAAANGCGGASGCGSAPTQAAAAETKSAATNGCGGVAGCSAPKQAATEQAACEGDACATSDE